MRSSVIKVENVSKLYRLGQVGTGTIQHDINRWWHRVRGKDDPYAKVGVSNDRTRKAGAADSTDYVWALKEVDFTVEQGEVLGLIGRNGAGKSTVLKLLSRVTAPTSGSIKVKGRIASLLEVGTGFHPELSGRENIYLNGAILGMRRQEITSKLDEIVDFSGCAAYLDTPVKRYSSGMYVRLAFAVAAYLEPEILIVDEVLAVGDAEFQKRCLSRMDKVSKLGKTVIFVSHNMSAMQSLCTSILRIADGRARVKSRNVEQEINSYLHDCRAAQPSFPVALEDGTRILGLELNPPILASGQSLSMIFDMEFSSETVVTDFAPIIYNQAGVRTGVMDGRGKLALPKTFSAGRHRLRFDIVTLPLMPGDYVAGLYLRTHSAWVNHECLGDIQVISDAGMEISSYPVEHLGILNVNFSAAKI
ncbi:MAG: ABC transporter ATP-binding protein [Prosthecobacter sp.]|uniref:ABC transporter ATP-binding protein n=1 Tax=Prosthecobacter sp. TaxID=1965333 RepID=UPI0019EABF0C|nr:ABC transporter ATP-binding protein [Prosthecobacter sp.]MBE2286413.1 ABC transporter ATP-binding protein [Prosthecobacter sp.]